MLRLERGAIGGDVVALPRSIARRQAAYTGSFRRFTKEALHSGHKEGQHRGLEWACEAEASIAINISMSTRCKWRPHRDSNPCFGLERATSWASGRWGPERETF